MKKIVLLRGGFSGEREISLKSARQIKKVLSPFYEIIEVDPADFGNYQFMINALKKIDPFIVFNGLHGADGENGEIQRILEEDNIKFTGSNAKASRIAMNKFESAEIAKKLRIPVPHKIILKNNETLSNDIIDGIEFPVILKPNSEGSSLGIFKIIDKENLQEKYELLNKQYSSILIEQFIPGRELTVSILGKEALPVVEIKPKEGWYDYNNKYIPGNTEYIAPADLNESEINTIQQFALRLFDEIGCKSYARVDFRYDGNKFYLLELNTLPGMTKLSLTPMAAKAANIGFEELFQRIIENS